MLTKTNSIEKKKNLNLSKLLTQIKNKTLVFFLLTATFIYIIEISNISFINSILIFTLIILLSLLIEIQQAHKWDYDVFIIISSLVGFNYYFNYNGELKYLIANILFLIIQICRIIWRNKR